MRIPSVRLGPWAIAVAVLVAVLLAAPARAEIEFGIPQPVPAPINEGGGFAYPWLSDSELTMFFAATSADGAGDTDLMYVTRPSLVDAWTAPTLYGGPFNTALSETFPSMTADGMEFYFQRTSNPFTHADGEIYVSRRSAPRDAWGEPELLAINSAGRDASPRISPDGLTLYFDSSRPQSEVEYDFNTWVATRESRDEPFETAEFFHMGLGFVTDDGLTHLFSMGPEGAALIGVPNVASDDLYMRRRDTPTGEFGAISHLSAPTSSSGLDCCMDLGALDGKLYFASSRPGAPSEGPLGFVNLWEAPIAQAVAVEVKPGETGAAALNLRSNGLLPVAILSTDAFDAQQVDGDTVLFGDPVLIADGAAPVAPDRWSFDDVDGDGKLDLALKFSMQELLASMVVADTTVEGYLAGETLSGAVIAGRDAVRITAIPTPGASWLLATALVAWIARSRK